MKLIPEETTLVIAGAWNSAIVTPEWIQKYGLKKAAGQEVPFQAVVPVGAGMFFEFPKFKFDGISIVVRPDAMILSQSDVSEEQMDGIETVAANTVGELKHTPVGGVGHNFGFCDEAPGVQFLETFTNSQNDLVGAAPDGWNVTSTVLVTTLTYGDTQVNLQRSVVAGKLNVKFNFHHTVLDGAGALKVLRGEGGHKRFRENYQVAVGIITQLYGALNED